MHRLTENSGHELLHLPHGDSTLAETAKLEVVSVVATEVIVVVIEVPADETEALPEEHTDLHLHADENSLRKEKTATTEDVTETETTMKEDAPEVLSIANESVREETETSDEMTVNAETSETNVMSEQTATTAKVWTNSM